MSLMAEINEEYLGYQITVRAGLELKRMGTLAAAWVRAGDDRELCHYTEFVDLGARGWPRDDEEASRKLAEQAFHRARGAILLDRAHELRGAEFRPHINEEFAEHSEEYLRGVALRAFKRLHRHDPWQQARIGFDDIGVALMEDARPDDIEYTLARLHGDGLIKETAIGHQPGYRLYMLTPAGLRMADELEARARSPEFLLGETLARVEDALGKHDPELVQSLRRQAERVQKAMELDEHEVGEVAHACEQIIWDFLDLDALWERSPAPRPPKERTRDRLRLILKASVSSTTEGELLEGLEQYVVAWFGPLEQFIHKYRKLPGGSERRHARRCVVYTYLLLGDLIDLLDL